MAAPSVFQHGLGGTTGADVATESPYWALAAGGVFYVGPGGNDAAVGSGGRREAPLATLSQAHTNAAAGDTIVLLENTTLTLAVAQTFNKANITVVSEGAGSTRARFTASGAINMFDVTAVGVQFQNLYFVASTAAATARIRTAVSGTIIQDCYFECGVLDTSRAVKFINGANYGTMRGCYFTSTGVTAKGAFEVDVGATMSGLWVEDVTVDGGSFGWTDTAVQLLGTLTGVKILRIDLLNNSDMWLAAAATGYVIPGESSGSAYIFTG